MVDTMMVVKRTGYKDFCGDLSQYLSYRPSIQWRYAVLLSTLITLPIGAFAADITPKQPTKPNKAQPSKTPNQATQPASDNLAKKSTNGSSRKPIYQDDCTPSPLALKYGIRHYAFDLQSSLVKVDSSFSNFRLHTDAARALGRMQTAAQQDGVQLRLVSAYRSHSDQQALIDERRRAGQSWQQIYHWVAPVGYSEHHTGFAMDFGEARQRFDTTPAYRWLRQHGSDFGFYQSYPAKIAKKNGIATESWHWVFLDSPAAKRALKNHACYAQ